MWAKDVRRITDDLSSEIFNLKERLRELEKNQYKSILREELIKKCKAYRITANDSDYFEYCEADAREILIKLADELVKKHRGLRK